MSQHDFNIDNQSAPAFRIDLNNALEALGTLSSGPTAPAATYANMQWYDTANNILKMRSEADDAWINIGTLDQSTNTFTPAGVAELSQAQAENDTSTVFGQVSGQRLSQAVSANVPDVMNASGSAPLYAARAWVNFQGSGAVTIRASGNVSSVTDNGTGNYTVNFTTTMPDANYAPVYAASSSAFAIADVYSLTAISFSVQFGNRGSSNVDPGTVAFAVFR